MRTSAPPRTGGSRVEQKQSNRTGAVAASNKRTHTDTQRDRERYSIPYKEPFFSLIDFQNPVSFLPSKSIPSGHPIQVHTNSVPALGMYGGRSLMPAYPIANFCSNTQHWDNMNVGNNGQQQYSNGNKQAWYDRQSQLQQEQGWG